MMLFHSYVSHYQRVMCHLTFCNRNLICFQLLAVPDTLGNSIDKWLRNTCELANFKQLTVQALGTDPVQGYNSLFKEMVINPFFQIFSDSWTTSMAIPILGWARGRDSCQSQCAEPSNIYSNPMVHQCQSCMQSQN